MGMSILGIYYIPEATISLAIVKYGGLLQGRNGFRMPSMLLAVASPVEFACVGQPAEVIQTSGGVAKFMASQSFLRQKPTVNSYS